MAIQSYRKNIILARVPFLTPMSQASSKRGDSDLGVQIGPRDNNVPQATIFLRLTAQEQDGAPERESSTS